MLPCRNASHLFSVAYAGSNWFIIGYNAKILTRYYQRFEDVVHNDFQRIR